MFGEQDSIVDPRDTLIHELTQTVRRQAATIAQQAEQLKKLEERIEKLQELLKHKADAKASKQPIFNENYSLDRNKRRKKKKPKKKSTGRKPFQAKLKQVNRQIDLYPEGANREQCIPHRSQNAWRIIDGKAIYVRYRIYGPPDSKSLPLPPGLRNSRSEFGVEIILILAFLHYWIGVSIDHARQIMEFFTGLQLSKSQTDSLLAQLASDWDQHYDAVAELIALQLIVYIDETGWKVGKKSCYTWVFSTALHVLYRCGVSRKKTEATEILGDCFQGIGVTDDYAAYKNLFSQHQLCWAHLIRKAIKLALQNPEQPEYAEFLDQLCLIYDDAKQCREAVESGAVESAAEVKRLEDRVTALCSRCDEQIVTTKAAEKAVPPIQPTDGPTASLILLQRELANQLECLFVFVKHPEVESTNNRSERNARREAEIRKGSRTNKTATGAKRRSVIVTVLASLATRITNFTLSALLSEIDRWLATGASIFQQELQSIQAGLPPPDFH